MEETQLLSFRFATAISHFTTDAVIFRKGSLCEITGPLISDTDFVFWHLMLNDWTIYSTSRFQSLQMNLTHPIRSLSLCWTKSIIFTNWGQVFCVQFISSLATFVIFPQFISSLATFIIFPPAPEVARSILGFSDYFNFITLLTVAIRGKMKSWLDQGCQFLIHNGYFI